MNHKDAIIISDLLIRCIVGINPDEREKKQDVLINITMHGDPDKRLFNRIYLRPGKAA